MGLVYCLQHQVAPVEVIIMYKVNGNKYNFDFTVKCKFGKVGKWRGCGIIKIYEFVQTEAED